MTHKETKNSQRREIKNSILVQSAIYHFTGFELILVRLKIKKSKQTTMKCLGSAQFQVSVSLNACLLHWAKWAELDYPSKGESFCFVFVFQLLLFLF